MLKFSVSFERYLPHDDGEDICEADERGFVVEDCSLRDAVRIGLEALQPNYLGACEADSFPPRGVRWLTFDRWNDCTRENIQEGISESRTLHLPEQMTESSRRRVCRLFGLRGV
jgi:hypothetical protein